MVEAETKRLAELGAPIPTGHGAVLVPDITPQPAIWRQKEASV